MNESISTVAEFAMPADRAFERLIDELSIALLRAGLRLEPGVAGGVYRGDSRIGRMDSWRADEGFTIEWVAAGWQHAGAPSIGVVVERIDAGARIRIEVRNLGRLFDAADEALGWFSSALAGPIVAASEPSAFGDWATDRIARRPTGIRARAIYADPTYHLPSFELILAVLAPTKTDRLLEVGCGGGVLLERVLERGSRAAGVDHSEEMVRLARERNATAVTEGRLEIVHAEADRLPFDDATFMRAAMAQVFFFFPDPLAALREVRRVLADGGRLAVVTAGKELRGTPAAPEPMASRSHFYEDEELRQLALEAGFQTARVERPDLAPFARAAGLDDEVVAVFENERGSQLLVADV